MENLSKRIIGAHLLGINFSFEDGHCHIEYLQGYVFDNMLKKHGIKIYTKFYGMLLEALDTIDHVLNLCKCHSLLEEYEDSDYSGGENWLLGNGGISYKNVEKKI